MPGPKFIDDRDQLEKLAPVMKAPIKRHVFVCNGKSCSQVGSAEVKAEFVRILEEKGIRQGKESKGRNPMGEVVLTDCGSVGFCSIGVAVLIFVVFVVIEQFVASPLMPLRLFKQRNLAVADVVGVLWAAAMFAFFFLTALYLQLVLGYSPLEVGLSFLPANLIMGALSIGVSAKLVMRYSFRAPLAAGLGLAGLAMLLFTRVPVDGDYVMDVLPSMILLGLGAGIAFNPVLLAAMSDVEPQEAGLASGIINTSFMMGGALGLAVLASVAASRTTDLVSSGSSQAEALTGGYHVAFFIGALFAFAGAAIGGLLLRNQAMAPHGAPEPATEAA